jgi:hypothetical protein
MNPTDTKPGQWNDSERRPSLAGSLVSSLDFTHCDPVRATINPSTGLQVDVLACTTLRYTQMGPHQHQVTPPMRSCRQGVTGAPGKGCKARDEPCSIGTTRTAMTSRNASSIILRRKHQTLCTMMLGFPDTSIAVHDSSPA